MPTKVNEVLSNVSQTLDAIARPDDIKEIIDNFPKQVNFDNIYYISVILIRDNVVTFKGQYTK